jgi:hypothetical protein
MSAHTPHEVVLAIIIPWDRGSECRTLIATDQRRRAAFAKSWRPRNR